MEPICTVTYNPWCGIVDALRTRDDVPRFGLYVPKLADSADFELYMQFKPHKALLPSDAVALLVDSVLWISGLTPGIGAMVVYSPTSWIDHMRGPDD